MCLYRYDQMFGICVQKSTVAKALQIRRLRRIQAMYERVLWGVKHGNTFSDVMEI